jgi:anaerobic magnesium-protoporphyrin IX monomethyl ester cyclase
MKVMLIQPPVVQTHTSYPPLGLACLGGCLEQAGHTVKIVDSLVLTSKQGILKEELSRFDPDVIGVTAMTQHINDALSIIRTVKELNPNCITVLGGPHPSVRAKEVLKNNLDVDVIVRGEGEHTFLEVLEKGKTENLHNVRGVSYRDNGNMRENEDRNFIENLDSLPMPAYHLLPMNQYKIKVAHTELFDRSLQNYGTISTCRGCPYGCIFCSPHEMWGKKWRAKSPETVVEELRLLREKYDCRVIDFMDDTFTISKKRAKEICALIKKESIDVHLMCATRVDLFDKEIASDLKKAGCFIVYFGFESGAQKTLDFLQKGFTVKDSEKAVEIARTAGLDVGGAFIIGVPGETRDMIHKTIAFAKKLNLKSHNFCFSLLVPFPGTKLYSMAEQNNLLRTNDWSQYTLSNSVLKIPGFTSEELITLRKEAEDLAKT